MRKKLVSITTKTTIFISIFLGLSVLVASSKALAQEHACMWVEHLPGVGLCEPISYCPSGFHPRTPCADFGMDECDGAHPCDPDPTPTPTPPAPCGQSCFSNADCASPCPYCEIVGGALKGTCTTAPTPTIPPSGGGVQPEECPVMGTTGIKTALGCIPTGDTSKFVAWFLKFAIGIGGGIAFLLMLFGAFQILTSSGDPERLKAGKELIGSALAGLLMIIFSLFLLRLIGIQILQIPGLE